jgi:hypothetical protein
MTISLRVLPRFPARLMATAGLKAERSDSDVIISYDWGSLIRIPAVADPDKVFFTAWNSDENVYSTMSFTDTFAAVVDTVGFMLQSVYDPQSKNADAFARANHTGTQAQSTVTNLVSALTGNPTAPTQSAGDNSTRIATTAYVDAADAATVTNLKWRSRFIGEVVFANTAITGAEIPPSSTTDTIWIELTVGLTGVGGFNNGKLTSESSSGSAPLVSATAVINFAGSPMNGQTVRLINTESRILRPSSSPGTLQNDAFQGHRHENGYTNIKPYVAGTLFGDFLATTPTNSTNTGILDPITDGTNGTPRTAIETRMKNIGVKAYMRIA